VGVPDRRDRTPAAGSEKLPLVPAAQGIGAFLASAPMLESRQVPISITFTFSCRARRAASRVAPERTHRLVHHEHELRRSGSIFPRPLTRLAARRADAEVLLPPLAQDVIWNTSAASAPDVHDDTL